MTPRILSVPMKHRLSCLCCMSVVFWAVQTLVHVSLYVSLYVSHASPLSSVSVSLTSKLCLDNQSASSGSSQWVVLLLFSLTQRNTKGKPQVSRSGKGTCSLSAESCRCSSSAEPKMRLFVWYEEKNKLLSLCVTNTAVLVSPQRRKAAFRVIESVLVRVLSRRDAVCENSFEICL